MNRLVVIVGPTGVGKSKLALHLAKTFNGEIVSADSRQVYCHMDIGTAKPSQKELSLVPHHLINIVNPDEDFSLAQYQELAYRTIDDIQRRDKLALLVGGSGLYIWSVLEGWGIPPVPPHPEFRHSMEEKAARIGKDELYQELMEVDPVAAQKIDRNNVRRVIRALEVYENTDNPFSRLQYKQVTSFNKLIIGLTMDRAELYRRIDLRVDGMIERGLVEEVEKLVNTGYGFNLPAMSGIGYKQIGMFLRGELALATVTQQIKFETHRFVRHQYNWFQLKDDRIRWFDVQSRVDSKITASLAGFVRG
ncbi:tRNA (adenosine(37)-N6)-dimethylallyltransferase MiaA [Chloroflexota bacterium]